MAAFGVSGWVAGCSGSPDPIPAQPRPAPTAAPAGPDTPQLPDPGELTAVLSRLADPAVAPEEKISLIQFGTADDRDVLRNFAEALAANGFRPPTITAANLAPAAAPGDVRADVTFTASDPAVAPFGYPLEFTRGRQSWELTQRSADQLFPLVSVKPTQPAGEPPAPPAPAGPPVAPPAAPPAPADPPR